MIDLFYLHEIMAKSKTIQNIWLQRAKVNINDTHRCFLQDLTRISSRSYIPTETDVLRSQRRTRGIQVDEYVVEGTDFEIYDVGGQRSERKKWMNCFDVVNAVIFVAALSEYDQMLSESKSTNRMMESLNLFESIVKNAHFAHIPIMLFLNKKDVFAEKIKHSDIASVPFFHDYYGPSKEFDHGVLYFIQKFEERLDDNVFSDSFIHVTNATDTNNMEFVLDRVNSMIVEEVSDWTRLDFFSMLL